jgi:hypothetical protein
MAFASLLIQQRITEPTRKQASKTRISTIPKHIIR